MTRYTHAVLGFSVLLQQSRWGLIYAQDGATPVSTTCSVDQYYAGLPSDPTTWTRDEVADLIRSTHTTIPPFTGTTLGEGDVWHALIQVDAGDDTDTVSLIFNAEDVNAFPVAARNWKKQHLWPTDRGIGESGTDYSDVHGIRPVDQISDVVRANKFFGDCGVLEKEGVCVEPAEGGGGDTCVCNRSYQPPADRRGEIARALMYMDLRYDGSEEDTTNLTLTDCPFNRTTDMGYLSQMLQWNTDSAPSEKETSRNDAVCEFWQGNRNPFVDFPGLADTLFGPKLDVPAAGREIYEACEDVPTSAPTFSDNDCQMINPGDVVFSLMNSEDPDNVELFVFEDLPAGLELYLTDNAWDGLKFLNAEGILKLEIPDGGISSGDNFGYGDGLKLGNEWSTFEGIFSLGTEGEQIFLFCYTGGGTVHPLAALSYNGPFSTPGLPSYMFNESAVPDGLENATIVLPRKKNWAFNSPTTGTREQVRPFFLDPGKWQGSDDFRYMVSPGAASAGNRPGFVAASMAMIAGITIAPFFAMFL